MTKDSVTGVVLFGLLVKSKRRHQREPRSQLSSCLICTLRSSSRRHTRRRQVRKRLTDIVPQSQDYPGPRELHPESRHVQPFATSLPKSARSDIFPTGPLVRGSEPRILHREMNRASESTQFPVGLCSYLTVDTISSPIGACLGGDGSLILMKSESV